MLPTRAAWRFGAAAAAGCLVGAVPLSGQRPAPAVPDVTIALARDARVATAQAEVDAARIRRTDSILVAFGTRHTMSDTLSASRGVGAARRFLVAELAAIAKACGGCLTIEYDAAMVTIERHPQKPVVNVVNVLAWMPGRDSSRVVVLGAHFDSCICATDAMDFTADAPGADDDGSGTSALLELTRVMSRRFSKGLDATVVFAFYAGEEQGLLGSTHLADRLHKGGYKVTAGMTDDIVGNVVAEDGTTDSTSIRVYGVDGEKGPGGELARYVWALGAMYQPDFEVRPTFRLDRLGRGGDHAPFARLGDASLRFTERLENYKRQHLPTDALADVNFGYVAKVARLNLAAVAHLAAAPAAPDSTTYRRDAASGGQKWMIAWKAVPGAARYELLVRRTTDATWRRVVDAGRATSFLLDEQLDDVWVGVRAVGADGHRSLATVVTTLAPRGR